MIRDVFVVRPLDYGIYGLDQSAVNALKQWKIKPGKVDGEAADVRMTLKLDFTLR